MYLGVIADDFTGASDIANTLAKGGLATTQFFGLPEDAAGDCDAGIVSLKTRSIEASDAIAQSLAALDWLKKQGCRQFIFKYCSTFDSTPLGNIGPVAEALAEQLGARGVVACPAFPTTGRTIYQGHLFVGDRLLNESGLENHPLNPMTDADIRRWLARQAKHPVGLVPIGTVRKGAGAIRKALEEAAAKGEWLAIVDAVEDRDLIEIGAACVEAPLITGGSGIALGLPDLLLSRRFATGRATPFTGTTGAGAILAGSCSKATLGQIEFHARSHPAREIDVATVLDGRTTANDLAGFIKQNRGKDPIVFSSAQPDTVRASQRQFGAERVAHALEQLFAQVAAIVVPDGFDRLVVAGGETSGAVVSGLRIAAVSIGPEIDPGVPGLLATGSRPVALALKSGNFGAVDFFDKALRTLHAPARTGTPS